MAGNDTVVFPDSNTVEIQKRDVPDYAADEVLIETSYTVVSTGTELATLAGDFIEESDSEGYYSFPFVPGYNNVGTVVDVGADVDGVAVGDRIATYTAHAQYTSAPADAVRPVPDVIAGDEAAFFTIAEIVSQGLRRGRLAWGETVVVYGCGLLGQLLVRLAQFAGAHPVVAVDISTDRLDYLPDDVHASNPRREDVDETVAALTDGRRADVVFEVTGNPDAIADEFSVLREQGRLVLVSSPRGETTLDFHDRVMHESRTIIGSHNHSHPPEATPNTPWSMQRHCELFFDLLAAGEIGVANLISHQRPYTDAPSLYEQLLEDRTQALGVVLEWD